MTNPDTYILGQTPVEQQRLRQQARELADDSTWLFDQMGLARDARVVEIGCGPEGCLGLLARRVGPGGAVVGVEISDSAVALARSYVAERALHNVEVRQGNGKQTALERGAFDVAMARLVLVNVPQPEAVLAEMASLARPGGSVALHEADWQLVVCDPPLAEWDELIDAFIRYGRGEGIDLKIGRRLGSMMRAAGLGDIHVRPLIHTYDVSHSRRPLLLELANNLRDRVLGSGTLSPARFDSCTAMIQQHLADPATAVYWTYFQAWATRA